MPINVIFGIMFTIDALKIGRRAGKKCFSYAELNPLITTIYGKQIFVVTVHRARANGKNYIEAEEFLIDIEVMSTFPNF